MEEFSMRFGAHLGTERGMQGQLKVHVGNEREMHGHLKLHFPHVAVQGSRRTRYVERSYKISKL